eukprot:jgi/Ulvmu1/12105/UM084_0030.1
MNRHHGATVNRALEQVQIPNDIGALAGRTFRSASRNTWVRASAGLWILGLLVVFVLPAPIAITDKKMERYNEKMLEVNAAMKRLQEAEDDLFQADLELRSEAGWFSWFASAEQKQVIAKFRGVRDELREDVSSAEHSLLLAQRDANKQLGLFSSHGKEVAKERLWDSFERAKIMGRRQTFLDGLGTIIFNRDRELMDIVARVAVYLVLNVTWAMFIMFWVFLAGLPRLIWTFGASWGEGLLFFTLAAIGAAAIMVTFTVGLGAATVGAVYGLACMSGRVGRLGGPTADGRRRIHGTVPGYTGVDLGQDRYFRQQRHEQQRGGGVAYTDAATAAAGATPLGHQHDD